MKDYEVSVSEDGYGLSYPGFSVVFMQTFAIHHERVFVMPKDPKVLEIFHPMEMEIESQIFILPQEVDMDKVCRFKLKGFDFVMPIEPEEDEDFEAVTLKGHVHVEMNLFFGNTASINYYFVFDGNFCTYDHPVVTDHLIALLSTFLGAEHWAKKKDEEDKTTINLSSVFKLSGLYLDDEGRISQQPLEKDLSGAGRMFDGVALLYKKFIYEYCTAFAPDMDAEKRAVYNKYRQKHPLSVNNDYHYAMVDIWENISHPIGDDDLFALDHTPKLSEAEIVTHIDKYHRSELIGLLTMYPGEWPYRDDRAYEEVCGENIAIDTDDLVLAGTNLCVVIGTYGRRNNSTAGVDWEEHLKERSHYFVSWPEYLSILQIVIAKKYIIGIANDALIEATLNKHNVSAQSLIGENANLSMRLSRRLLQLDVIKYSKFASHKIMFDRTKRRFGLDEDLESFNNMMGMVDNSLQNLSSYKAMRSDFSLNVILAIISCVSTFELLFQEAEMPFLSYFGMQSSKLAALLVSVVAGISIFAILLVLKNFSVSIYEKIKEHFSLWNSK